MTTARSGVAMTPPLKPPTGVLIPRGSISMRKPRGGRLLMIEKMNSACAQFCHGRLGARGQHLVIGDQRAIDIRNHGRTFEWQRRARDS